MNVLWKIGGGKGHRCSVGIEIDNIAKKMVMPRYDDEIGLKETVYRFVSVDVFG